MKQDIKKQNNQGHNNGNHGGLKNNGNGLFYFFDNVMLAQDEKGGILFDFASPRFRQKSQTSDGMEWVHGQISTIGPDAGDNLEKFSFALDALRYVRDYGSTQKIQVQQLGKSTQQKIIHQVLGWEGPCRDFIHNGHRILLAQALQSDGHSPYLRSIAEKKLAQKISFLVRSFKDNPSLQLKKLIRVHLKMYQVQHPNKKVVSLLINEQRYAEQIYRLLDAYRETFFKSAAQKEKIQIHLALFQKYWGRPFSQALKNYGFIPSTEKILRQEEVMVLEKEGYALKKEDEQKEKNGSYAFDLLQDLDAEILPEEKGDGEQSVNSLWDESHYAWGPVRQALMEVVVLFCEYRRYQREQKDYPRYRQYVQKVTDLVRLFALEWMTDNGTLLIGGKMQAYLADIGLALIDRYYPILKQYHIDVQDVLACLKTEPVIVCDKKLMTCRCPEEIQNSRKKLQERKKAWAGHGKYAEASTSQLIAIALLIDSAISNLEKITGKKEMVEKQIEVLKAERKTLAHALAERLACYWEEGHDDVLYREYGKLQELGLQAPFDLPRPVTQLLAPVSLDYPLLSKSGETEKNIQSLISQSGVKTHKTKNKKNTTVKNNMTVAMEFVLRYGDLGDQRQALGLSSDSPKSQDEMLETLVQDLQELDELLQGKKPKEKTQKAATKKYVALFTYFFDYRLEMSVLEKQVVEQRVVTSQDAQKVLSKIQQLKERLSQLKQDLQKMKITSKSPNDEKILAGKIEEHIKTAEKQLRSHVEANLVVYYQEFQRQGQDAASFLRFVQEHGVDSEALQSFLQKKSEDICQVSVADFQYFLQLLGEIANNSSSLPVRQNIDSKDVAKRYQESVQHAVGGIVALLKSKKVVKLLSEGEKYPYLNENIDVKTVLAWARQYGAHEDFALVYEALAQYVKDYQGEDNEYLDIVMALDLFGAKDGLKTYAQKRFAYLLEQGALLSQNKIPTEDQRLFDYVVLFYPDVFDALLLQQFQQENISETQISLLKLILRYGSRMSVKPILQQVLSLTDTISRAQLLNELLSSSLWHHTPNKASLLSLVEEAANKTPDICLLGQMLADEEMSHQPNSYYADWLLSLLQNPGNVDVLMNESSLLLQQQKRHYEKAYALEKFALLSDEDKARVLLGIDHYFAQQKHEQVENAPVTDLVMMIVQGQDQHPVPRHVRVLQEAVKSYRQRQAFYQNMKELVESNEWETIKNRIRGMMNFYQIQPELAFCLQQDFLEGLYRYFEEQVRYYQDEIQKMPSSVQLVKEQHSQDERLPDYLQALDEQSKFLVNRKEFFADMLRFIRQVGEEKNIGLRTKSCQGNAFQTFLQKDENITLEDLGCLQADVLLAWANAAETTRDKKALLEKLQTLMLHLQQKSREENPSLPAFQQLIYQQAAQVIRELSATILALSPARVRGITFDRYTQKMIERLQVLLAYEKKKDAQALVEYCQQDVDFLVGKAIVYQFSGEEDDEAKSLETVIDYAQSWEKIVKEEATIAYVFVKATELKQAVYDHLELDIQTPEMVPALFSVSNAAYHRLINIFNLLENGHSSGTWKDPREIQEPIQNAYQEIMLFGKAASRKLVLGLLEEKYQELEKNLKTVEEKPNGTLSANKCSELYYYASLQEDLKGLFYLLLPEKGQQEKWDQLFQRLDEKKEQLSTSMAKALLISAHKYVLKDQMLAIKQATYLGFTKMMEFIEQKIERVVEADHLTLEDVREFHFILEELQELMHYLKGYVSAKVPMTYNDREEKTQDLTKIVQRLEELLEVEKKVEVEIKEQPVKISSCAQISFFSSSFENKETNKLEILKEKTTQKTCFQEWGGSLKISLGYSKEENN